MGLSRNDKRGCVAYIYTLSNDPTPFPAIPQGGGWLKRKPVSASPYFKPAGELLPGRQTARQPQRNRRAAFQDACPACFCNSLCSAQRRPVTDELRFQGVTILFSSICLSCPCTRYRQNLRYKIPRCRSDIVIFPCFLSFSVLCCRWCYQ